MYGFLRERRTSPRANVRLLCTGVRARHGGKREGYDCDGDIKTQYPAERESATLGNVGTVRRWKVMTLLECTCMGIRYSPLEKRGGGSEGDRPDGSRVLLP